MKKTFALILTLAMLCQALPWTAFAAMGEVLTEAELNRTLQIAGLRQNPDYPQFNGSGERMLRLTAKASVYHTGMEPEDTWDALTLVDWLDDKLSTDFYNVARVFSRADSLLARMKTEDPASYAKFTASEYAGFEYKLHTYMIQTESIEEKAHHIKDRLGDNVALIENSAEAIFAQPADLFETEQLRLSERIRGATGALTDLRGQALGLSRQEQQTADAYRRVIDGEDELEFSKWLHALLTSGEAPQTTSVSANQVRLSGGDTRLSRLGAGGSVLNNADPGDIYITVINMNEFALEFHGVDNEPLGGVKCTVRDFSNPDTVLEGTSDPVRGNIVFDATGFVNHYDYGMELILEVDASAAGYRSFYIPWALVGQGKVLRYYLTLLTGPEGEGVADNRTRQEKETEALRANADGKTKPYPYSCSFNGYDIIYQAKKTEISPQMDEDVSFELVINHSDTKAPEDPVLHYKEFDQAHLGSVWKEMKPTQTWMDVDDRTHYTYTKDFKRILATGLIKEESPYFIIQETGEKIKTKLTPVRAKVDQPIYTGQESSNPMMSVIGKGVGFDFKIPQPIDGMIGFNLPFDKYLPKVYYDPSGYITVSWGSSLVPKDKTESFNWKNTEAEAYDEAMAEYEHDVSLTQKLQQTGNATKLYKKMPADSKMTRKKLDFGWFIAGAGKFEEDNNETLGAFSASFGANVVFTYEFTKPFTLGPVPFYLDFLFSASAGVGIDGIHVTFRIDKNQKPYHPDFQPANNITIAIRIAITVTFGLGVKGVVSVWVACSAGVRLVFSLNKASPATVTAYFEAFISAGLEVFFIKYSRILVQIPEQQLYPSSNANGAPEGLFAAYANDDGADENVHIVGTEPARYPNLAPKATETKTSFEGTNFKALSYRNWEIVFYIENTTHKLRIENNTRGYGNYIQDYLPGFGKDLSAYKTCDYDVYSDGKYLHLLATLAKSLDGDGKPVPGGTKENPNILVCYLQFEGYEYDDYWRERLGCKNSIQYPWVWDNIKANGLSPICSTPKIESVISNNKGNVEVYGSIYGQSDEVDMSQFNLFYIEPDKRNMVVYGDLTVGINYNLKGEKQYRRVELHSNMRNAVRDLDDPQSGWPAKDGRVPSLGFTALETPVDGDGDNALVLFDYYQNNIDAFAWEIDGKMHVGGTRRRPIILTEGDISSYQVLQFMDKDGVHFSQTIFYTQLEEQGERVVNHLKGFYVSPVKPIGNINHWYYDYTVVDYDINLPTADFRVASIGASQYIYWLNTVSKEKESDPDMWRISGAYYDSATNSFSDVTVIAEFTLPDVSYNGKTYKAVPQEVTLADNGMGYITVVPDTGEQDTTVPPATLYSFPTTLTPSMKLQKAVAIETTVLQGDFLRTQFTMHNDGNTGIGSFDIDVMLLNDGRETKNVESLHAGLLMSSHSKVTLHRDDGTDEVVAAGEAAVYRDKDFQYSPRQQDWTVKEETMKEEILNGIPRGSQSTGSNTNYVSTNALVPSSLGCFVGNIKIPDDWHGNYDLRMKLSSYSIYDNYIAASTLAKTHPELFADEGTVSNAVAAANRKKLAEYGIYRLDYALDEASGKLVLQNRDELVANAGEEAVSLYALEVDAPDGIEINFDVHDIDVSHRLYSDYYGEDILDITLNNFYQNDEAIELTCAMYLNGASEPVYVSLPYKPEVISTGASTTISVPLKALFDPDAVQTARFVFTPRGIRETATLNNEFTIYPGGGGDPLRFSKQPEDVSAQEGEDVSFSVEVDGGVEPYTYQWQIFNPKTGKWVDLKGFTDPTLNREDIEKKWDGCRFRCVVTDAEGTQIISQEVTLTIRDRVDTGDHSNLTLYLAVVLASLILLWWLRRRRA